MLSVIHLWKILGRMESAPHPLCLQSPQEASTRMEKAPHLFYLQPLKGICMDGEHSSSILFLDPQRICIAREYSPQK
jgi:hypothetical protein